MAFWENTSGGEILTYSTDFPELTKGRAFRLKTPYIRPQAGKLGQELQINKHILVLFFSEIQSGCQKIQPEFFSKTRWVFPDRITHKVTVMF